MTTSSLTVHRVVDADELVAVDLLYRDVFGIRPDQAGMNLRLLIALSANSGHVLGAYDHDRLVGFGLSFLARDRTAGRLYQYSQTVAVAADAQSRGVGRAVKQAQRSAALDDGIDLMRWTFDPMQARNAHFNLDVLGGRVRRVERDYYGAHAPGRDEGERTDRGIVDWELAVPARAAQWPEHVDVRPGQGRRLGERVVVGVPADWSAHRHRAGRDGAAHLRAATVDLLAAALADGLVAASCRRIDESRAAYLLVPRSEA